MDATTLLNIARKWQRPGLGAPRSKRRYTNVDPTIDHLAQDGWSAKEITDQLIQARAWPAKERNALYHHTARRLARSK